MTEPACPFCNPDASRVFHAGKLVLGLWDGFPVTPGHALLITKRHVASFFDTTPEERAELVEATFLARAMILERQRSPAPEAFNLGVNVGASAGQTVFHLHLHVIPRYPGDVADPSGGIRHVIPERARYGKAALLPPQLVKDQSPPAYAATALLGNAPHENALIRGDLDPLLPHLLSHFAWAKKVDLAVAFIFESGVRKIEGYLRDFLENEGHARILTGDYMGATEPEALLHLLDLTAMPKGRLELYAFETAGQSFHPKAYVFQGKAGDGIAYVGSSNLSATALTDGLEWNLRVVTSRDRIAFGEISTAFEKLLAHERVRTVDPAWIDAYRARRPTSAAVPIDIPREPPLQPPDPHEIQREALEALIKTRAAGNEAGLVVMATGLGKTWLAAFDSARDEFRRVLFVAHREEILTQAMATFRRIRPGAHLGLYTGEEKAPDADVLFASVQTLGKRVHLGNFDPRAFDYVVIDEFHHAAAATYRRVIDHFEPRFLLGLTATPERADGGDLLALCQENLVYRCDLFRAIELGLLAPFHYFGVPDEVDYSNIPWRNSRFDPEALTEAVATRARAQNALEQWKQRGGSRTLAFCCSQRHADFMQEFFREADVKAVSVHAGASSAPRADSLEKLERGELQVVFAVDMFNEGVDLPHVDTVLMLRPTESRVLWLQQFGRGLRRADGKPHLTVVDYIGNHRSFLLKPQTLLSLGAKHAEIAHALEQVQAGTAALPPGCEVTYDLAAINILRSLLRIPKDDDALSAYYLDFRERHGTRPTALEAHHDGYAPRATRTAYGSWLGFVASMGDLTVDQSAAHEHGRAFLTQLEATPMTKSFKMLVLLAMLNEDAFPGEISLDRLCEAVARLARRSAQLRQDVGPALDQPKELRQLLIQNPIAAWTGGRGTGGETYFRLNGEQFSSTLSAAGPMRAALQELTRELADWRLAEYLDRSGSHAGVPGRIVCKVSHTNGKPILFLPDRELHPEIPSGTVEVTIDGKPHEADFVKIAVNVVRAKGGESNDLPAILRGWFGADAGRPGTNFHVAFEPDGAGFRLVPLGRRDAPGAAELWRSYSREQIPGLFGLEFRSVAWRQTGFIVEGNDVFLLVTLNKGTHPEAHRYQDRFLGPDLFQWQSQNRTTQKSKHGQLLQHHSASGIRVHLFIRKDSKIARTSCTVHLLRRRAVRRLGGREANHRALEATGRSSSAVSRRAWECPRRRGPRIRQPVSRWLTGRKSSFRLST